MKKSFAIIGLGRFGLAMAKTLINLKSEVIAMDIDEDRVKKASKFIPHCVICDATKKENLEDLGINNVDEAIVAIGQNLQATILTTINLKDIGVKRVSVRVDDEAYMRVIERLGATEVFIPEEECAVDFAKSVAKSDNIDDYYEIDKHYGIIQFKVSKNFSAKSIIDLDVRKKFDVIVVAINKSGKIILPSSTDLIEPDDILYVVGKYDKTLKFEVFIDE